MKLYIVFQFVILSCFLTTSVLAQTVEQKIADENIKPPSIYKRKRVEYDLYIGDTIVNYTGRK